MTMVLTQAELLPIIAKVMANAHFQRELAGAILAALTPAPAPVPPPDPHWVNGEPVVTLHHNTL
jgi:hypothetical protein